MSRNTRSATAYGGPSGRPRRTPERRRAGKAWLLLALGAGVIGTAALAAGVAWGAMPSAAPRAVLIDQLGAVDPHADFPRQAEAVLSAAGYALEIVPPAEATVRRFQALPADGADLIVLRVHSALIIDGGHWTDDVALFTNEPVDLGAFAVTGLAGASASGSAPAGRSADRASGGDFTPAELSALVPVRRSVGPDTRPYLGLGSTFVRSQLHGRFKDDAVVLLMGCDGLRGRRMSEAFLERGAKAVIGWSDQVSMAHTDRATVSLLADLAARRTPTDAIRRAMLTFGRDPVSGAYLIAAMR